MDSAPKAKRLLILVTISAAAVLLAGSLSTSAVAKSAPVAAYSFDKGEGTLLEDVTGNGHDGILEGPQWSAGKYGGALEFDGTDDCVSIPESTPLQFVKDEEFTLEAWVRPVEETNSQAIVTQEDDNADEGEDPFAYSMLVGGEEEPKGWLRKGGESGHVGTGGTEPLPVNAWSHIAFTDDGSRIRFYVDGELVGSQPAIPLTAAKGPVTIGCLDNYGNYFNGRVDEVRIYDRVLDESEVAADMATPTEIPPSAPVAAYSFDEGEGKVAEDLAGQHHGDLKNTDWVRGKYGSAIYLDGNGDYVEIPDSPQLQLTEEYTLEAWVRPDAVEAEGAVISKTADNFFSYQLFAGSREFAGIPEGFLGYEPWAWDDVEDESPLEPKTWNHLAVTYDGSRQRLYVNGELVDTSYEPTPPGMIGEGPLYLGGNEGEEDFKGRIDEVRIYARVLDERELGADKAAPIETPSRGPVAAYSFDAGEGSVLTDNAGEHDGAIEGAEWSDKGRYGKALFFSGEETCVTVPHAADLQLDEEFTLESWVKPHSLSDQPILYKSAWGNIGYALGISLFNTARPEGFIGEGPGQAEDVVAPEGVEENAWVHLAFTYDGATMRLYVDGELVATQAQSTPPPTGEGPLAIGCNPLYPEDFDGLIDEVRIYDRALDSGEIAADKARPIETPSRGPVAAYSFDDGQGEVAVDQTGNNHGSLINTEWVKGRYGNAIHLDGSDDYVEIPGSSELALSEEFTIETWVRTDEDAFWEAVIWKETQNYWSYALTAGGEEAGVPEGALADEVSSWVDVEGKEDLTTKTWNHLALTYDGANLRLYVNGELVDTEAASPNTENSEGKLFFGTNEDEDFFDGRIDEVRLYDRALDAGEIAADKATPIETPPRGPVAAYSFDEGQGEVAVDQTGNHNGVLENTEWVKGREGSAIYLDGNDDYAEIPDSPELQLGEEYTLEAWVRPDAVEAEGAVISKTASNFYSYQLYAGSREFAGIPEGFLGYEPWAWDDVEDETPLAAKTWSHLAVTYDGSRQRLYVNGELVDTSYEPTPPGMAGAGPLYLGSNEDEEDFKGRIDEVRIYDRALEASELTADKVPPDTFIIAAPRSRTNDATPTFLYRASEGGGRFECSLDGPFDPCGPAGYAVESPLEDGSHTFRVKAIDAADNADLTPAIKTFVVDTVAPTLKIKTGPSGPTTSSKPTFTFSSSGATTVRCAIDLEVGGPDEPSYGPCTTSGSHTSPATLADGSYVFRVQASDRAGNQVTEERAFTVDTVAPQTTIDSGPSGTTDEAKPTFTFSSSEPASTFKCRFDLEAFRACSGPGSTDTRVTALADGSHTFEVRAIDPANNPDATPATRAFTVNTAGPQTTIDSGPSGAIGTTSATFKYSADETATFQCRLDSAPFAACPAGEKAYAGLPQGEHVFEVRAVNALPVTDPTPARRTFVVDTSAPPAPVVTGAVREPGVPGLRLRIEAKDGEASSATAKRSGVEAIKVFADGQLVETFDARCKDDLCPSTVVRDVQLPHQKVIGKHTYVVEAVDGVGHSTATASWAEETADDDNTVYRRTATASKAPTCREPAEREYKHLNRIHVTKNQKLVTGSNEADLIISRPGVDTIQGRDGCDVIIGGPSEEVINGEDGADLILGGRSNDKIYGEDGNDRIYGGIGDDRLKGGNDNDVLDGGPGADRLKGEKDTDTTRGGQGEDTLSGGPGPDDTLSYADAHPLGWNEFGKRVQEAKEKNITNFPQPTESGVYMDLNASPPKIWTGNTGAGSGNDLLSGGGKGQFERIVGSAFSDWIEGNAGANLIDPGPGPDVVLDKGGATVNGDEDDSVEKSPNQIDARDSAKVHIGIQSHQGTDQETDVYLIGSNGSDNVRVKVTSNAVYFIAKGPATNNAFKSVNCGEKKGSTIACRLKQPLGALVIFGAAGKDTIRMLREERRGPGGIVIDGGADTDHLRGGAAGELVIDGTEQWEGTEDVHGGGGDDAVFQGDGSDFASGDGGNDLVISTQICNNDRLYGDNPKKSADKGADNAQFHPLANVGVYADLENGKLGVVGEKDNRCFNGTKQEPLLQFNDLEGSPKGDFLQGSSNSSNLLLGRGGVDRLFSLGKNDLIHARDDQVDDKVNCGGGADEAHVNGEKEKRKAESEGCEDSNYEGARVNHRLNPSFERESEPPALGEVVMPEPQAEVSSYYMLNENGGTAAENLAEEEPNGTYMAAGFGPSVNGPGPVLGSEGALLGEEEGTAVTLDGVDDYIDLNGRGLPEADATGYSVEMLVKFTGAPAQREFLFSASDGGKGGEGIYLYREPGGRLVFATGLDQGAPQIKAPGQITDQQWHQVIGSVEGETLTLNIDGFPYRLGHGENVMPKPSASPQALVGAGPGPAQFLAAVVDEVAIFQAARSPGEALQAMAESKVSTPEFLLSTAPETADVDGDGITDGADNCPSVSNAAQTDVDFDGIGDACEPPDADGDDVPDAGDNCPWEYNPEQTDSDGNGMGNACVGMPPDVETGEASAITSTSATLKGTVNPEGSATTYQFEYGTTTAYGTKAPAAAVSAGSGISPVSVSNGISGLAPNTTYHYRLVATNAAGEVEGADGTFVTKP